LIFHITNDLSHCGLRYPAHLDTTGAHCRLRAHMQLSQSWTACSVMLCAVRNAAPRRPQVQFIEALTNVYVRFNRTRLKGRRGEADCRMALACLFDVLLTVCKARACGAAFQRRCSGGHAARGKECRRAAEQWHAQPRGHPEGANRHGWMKARGLLGGVSACGGPGTHARARRVCPLARRPWRPSRPSSARRCTVTCAARCRPARRSRCTGAASPRRRPRRCARALGRSLMLPMLALSDLGDQPPSAA